MKNGLTGYCINESEKFRKKSGFIAVVKNIFPGAFSCDSFVYLNACRFISLYLQKKLWMRRSQRRWKMGTDGFEGKVVFNEVAIAKYAYLWS